VDKSSSAGAAKTSVRYEDPVTDEEEKDAEPLLPVISQKSNRWHAVRCSQRGGCLVFDSGATVWKSMILVATHT